MSAASPEHVAVMVAEVVGLVRACNPAVVVDATVGTGGHAEAILEAIGTDLIGLDRDCGALKIAAHRLERFGGRVRLRRANFAELTAVLDQAATPAAGVILADLGMSSFALNDPARGFSFVAEGPLDMRMDDRQKLRAYDLVNEESEEELARLIHAYGEERHARRIARAVVAARRRRPLESTGELRAAIEAEMGGRRHGGISPATRTFQALRMAVNDETASLAALLEAGPARLAAGGRMIVMAYHSLEDRPVKRRFRELATAGGFNLITRRALRPAAEEIARNRRARSARLRCLEKAPG
ncbi:MAG: 16S rRNA (cytosine(1402)-N(4))-methyltransferase RsmH [Candidatus Binataceae bacterium]